jgi:hypothetical protein
MPMNDQELLARVMVDPQVCQGKPFIRGTRIYIWIGFLCMGFFERPFLWPELYRSPGRVVNSFSA